MRCISILQISNIFCAIQKAQRLESPRTHRAKFRMAQRGTNRRRKPTHNIFGQAPWRANATQRPAANIVTRFLESRHILREFGPR